MPTQVLVTTQDRSRYLAEYLQLAKMLRGEGISTEVYLEPHALRDQIGYASANGIVFAVIAGESEFGQNNVTVKDLVQRRQETISQDSLIGYIRGRLSATCDQ